MIKSFLEKLSGKIPAKQKRHKNWSKFRKVYLKTYPRCAVCGSYKKLEIHHIIPVHTLRIDQLNLIFDPSNLCILCHKVFPSLMYNRKDSCLFTVVGLLDKKVLLW